MIEFVTAYSTSFGQPALSSDFCDLFKGVRMARAHSNIHQNHHHRLLCGEILSRWKQLTTADVEECGSDRSKLINMLQDRYGYAKRIAEKEVELLFFEFQERLRMAA
jgi:hypothetical protein